MSQPQCLTATESTLSRTCMGAQLNVSATAKSTPKALCQAPSPPRRLQGQVGMKMADESALQDADSAAGSVGAAISCARASMLAATDKAIAQAERGKPAVTANLDSLVHQWNKMLTAAAPDGTTALLGRVPGQFFFPSASGGGLERRPPRMKFEL